MLAVDVELGVGWDSWNMTAGEFLRM